MKKVKSQESKTDTNRGRTRAQTAKCVGIGSGPVLEEETAAPFPLPAKEKAKVRAPEGIGSSLETSKAADQEPTGKDSGRNLCVHPSTQSASVEGQPTLSPASKSELTLTSPAPVPDASLAGKEGEVELESQEKEFEESEVFFLAPDGTGENLVSNRNPTSPTTEDDQLKGRTTVSTDSEQKAFFFTALADINSKLSKLDTLESLNIKLEGNLSSVKARVEDVSNSIEAVKTDLHKYDQKWEKTAKDLSGRIDKLEKSSQSWEKRWELHREAVQGDCKVLQASIDSNSKKVIEVDSFLDGFKQKCESLYKLEDKIKDAAEHKFHLVQKAIREDLRKEILDEVSEVKSEVTHQNLKEIEELRKGLMEEVNAAKPPEVSHQNLERLREEILTQVQVQNKNSSSKGQEQSRASPKESQYNMLKGQAFSKRHNILIFGLPDNDSSANDLKEAYAFFENRMGLSGLKLKVTYRLGPFRQEAPNPRPLVVKFVDIKDRWKVWNNKSRISVDKDHPIRIQEDLPKKLREDARVLQRIARVARDSPSNFGEVRVKDYKISINGVKHGIEEVYNLPPELHPEQVYTPRSKDAVVFFTKHSPLSNHHHAPFSLNGGEYSCIEQYLAVSKAKLAKDPVLERRAMETNDPADHKVILNKLREKVQEQWAVQAPEIILPAVRAKFSQNEQLSNFLISTHPLPICEASRDPIWGVGLHLEHERVLDRNSWERHGNLLGITLTQVRAELMEAMYNPPRGQ